MILFFLRLPFPAKMAATEELDLPVFRHPAYDLVDDSKLQRKKEAPPSTDRASHEQESQSLIEALSSYLRKFLRIRFDMVEAWIPSDDTQIKCDILLSRNYETADKLLVLVQNHVGSQMGMWSRSTCLSEGLRKGSMIPILEMAEEKGYGVIILNPNTNSITISEEDGPSQKTAIPESSSPEEHTHTVYEDYIAPTKARSLYIVGYGNGAILAKEMVQRQLVRSASQETNRITAIALVEASTVIQEDDSADVKAFISKVAVNWDSNSIPAGQTINRTKVKLGVAQSFSLGEPGEGELTSTAWSINEAKAAIFRYFEVAGSSAEADKGYFFACEEAKRLGIAAPLPEESGKLSPGRQDEKQSFFSRFMKTLTFSGSKEVEKEREESKSISESENGIDSMQIKGNIHINDFDLLKVRPPEGRSL